MTGWRTLAALAGVSLAGAVAAQDYRPLPPQLEGEIAESDAADAQGRRFDEYPVELGRGDSVIVSAMPAAGSRLVPLIEIFAGETVQPLTRDAAEPGTRAARLSFQARDAGVYRIRILGGTAAAGRYLVQVRRAAASAPSRGFGGSAVGGTIGAIGGSALPSPAPHSPGDGAVPSAGPHTRFIVCPGHPRCPR